jgi:hypothetical protein
VTRIVLDPVELRRVADHSAEAAEVFEREAVDLEQRVLPVMPPHVQANATAGLEEVAARLRTVALQYNSEAFDLRLRASIATQDLTGFGAMAWGALLDRMWSGLSQELPVGDGSPKGEGT